jgi:hypothetical protein
LRLIPVENFEGRHVTRDWGVCASQFVVLLPEICLDQFRGGQELENRDVAAREALVVRAGYSFARSSD